MNGSVIVQKITSFASVSSSAAKKLWDPLWKVLSFSIADDRIYPAKTVSASLEKGRLSVAYASRLFSRIRIRGVREYPFEEGKFPPAEAFASSLSLAISDLGASRAEITLIIPKAWAVIKTTEFPATIKENLSTVISYELDRITPFNAENAFYDFRVTGEHEGKLSLMLIAAKADLLRPYLDALSEKGIRISRLTITLTGIETLCRYSDRKTDAVFLKVKRDSYESALCLNGTLTRAVAGSFVSDDEKSNMEAVVKGISSLSDAGKTSVSSLAVVAILEDKNPVYREMLQAEFSQSVQFLSEADIKTRLPGSYGEIPYTAFGGALESLWQQAKPLNLLKKGTHERPGAPLVLTIILACILLGMWVLYLIAPLRIEEKRLQEIDRQIVLRKEEVTKVEALKKEVEALSAEIATINDFKGKTRMDLDIMKELTTILPKTAWVSRVKITEEGVTLEGYAASATGILSKLEASPFFAKAEFASPTFRDTRMNADRFNIRMEIEGFKKEPAEEETAEEDDEEKE